jgi:hypothetical protein
MEFHTLVPTTGVDVPGMIVDYALAVGGGKIFVQTPTMAQSMAHSFAHLY